MKPFAHRLLALVLALATALSLTAPGSAEPAVARVLPGSFQPNWGGHNVLWLQSNRGITFVQGSVVATGTTPPAVTFTGAPSTTTNTIVLTGTSTGALGTAAFSWALNGVAQTPFTSAASVVLTGTGITATFPTGTYTSGNTYTSVVSVSRWADQSGGGNDVTQATATNQPAFQAVNSNYFNLPTLNFNGASPQWLAGTSPIASQPWTFYFLGGTGAAAGNQFLIDLHTDATFAYTYAESQFYVMNAGASLIGPDVAGRGSLACVFNGTTSAIYTSPGAPVTVGNAGAAATNGTLLLGADSSLSSSNAMTGNMAVVLAYSGAHTQAQVSRVLAYLNGLRGTGVANTLILDGNSFLAYTQYGLASDIGTPLLSFGGAYKNNGVQAETTPQMNTLALTATDPFIGSGGGPGNVVVGIEITNDVAEDLATAATAYANIQAYCAARRAAGWKVIVTTFLSRSNAFTPANFNATRATVNANIQANWQTFADGLADWASDPIMGIDGAETNLTYFSGDLVHPNATGMALLATYVIAAIHSLGFTMLDLPEPANDNDPQVPIKKAS